MTLREAKRILRKHYKQGHIHESTYNVMMVFNGDPDESIFSFARRLEATSEENHYHS